MSNPLLEARQLTKTFPPDTRVLQEIDFTLESGIHTITGASGVGKSTLMHILGGLEAPTSGEVLFDGQLLNNFSDGSLARLRNREIGFVFQFHHLLPEFSALENLMLPGMMAGTARGELQKRVEYLLDRVGLAHRMHHKPGELSGGEQQRVALARALVNQPRIVLADEPTGNLDSQNSTTVAELIADLAQNDGHSFLIVTHSQELAGIADRHLHMVDGGQMEPVNETE
jgi:lipoprotein-releasing system ATP-binding protein